MVRRTEVGVGGRRGRGSSYSHKTLGAVLLTQNRRRCTGFSIFFDTRERVRHFFIGPRRFVFAPPGPLQTRQDVAIWVAGGILGPGAKRAGWRKPQIKKTTGKAGAPQKKVPPGLPPPKATPRDPAGVAPTAQLPPPSRCFEFKMATRPVWEPLIGQDFFLLKQTGGFLTEKAAFKRIGAYNKKCYKRK
jgi:hypothetical protein